MPRQLEEFPENHGPGRKGGNSQFDPFLDGNVWELEMDDFPGYKNIETLRGGILGLAYKRKIKVRTATTTNNTLIIQRLTEDEA